MNVVQVPCAGPEMDAGEATITWDAAGQTWDELDALFIGGTTAWKLGRHARTLVREAKLRGKHVHMGRVNSGARWRYAEHIGCDSVDGTYLVFGPDENLPKLLAWTTPSLFGGAA